MTISEMIQQRVQDIHKAIRQGELNPNDAKTTQVELALLLGNVLDERTKTEIAFKKVLANCYEVEKKANRAKLMAEISPEYETYKKVDNIYQLTVEVIRSLKAYIRASMDEWEANYSN